MMEFWRMLAKMSSTTVVYMKLWTVLWLGTTQQCLRMGRCVELIGWAARHVTQCLLQLNSWPVIATVALSQTWTASIMQH